MSSPPSSAKPPNKACAASAWCTAGLGSPGKTPVLKGRVQSWLVQKQEGLAFVQTKPADGGAGALVVVLRGELRFFKIAAGGN